MVDMAIINEGSIKLKIHKADKISKEMPVFYNPVMSFNRYISILLLNSIKNKNMQIADPLAASGVRSVRLLKELNKNKIKKIYINDYDKKAFELIKQNLKLNKIQYKNNEKIINMFITSKFSTFLTTTFLFNNFISFFGTIRWVYY